MEKTDPAKGAPILDHRTPTDDELYELLLIGLRIMRQHDSDELGRMANGIFTALSRCGVMTEAYRSTLGGRLSLISLVQRQVLIVRPATLNDVPKELRRHTLLGRVADEPKDIFLVLRHPEAPLEYPRLVGTKGYRLYITSAGLAKAATLAGKYPELTFERFMLGWANYVRRARAVSAIRGNGRFDG